LAASNPLVAQPEQSSTADTTISSEIQSPDSEPHRTQPASTPDKSSIDSTTDVEIQRRLNELRRDLLDYRLNLVDWWLIAVAIFLTLLGIFVSILFGYFTLRGFRKTEAEARPNVVVVVIVKKTAIFLTFLGIFVSISGPLILQRFHEFRTEVRNIRTMMAVSERSYTIGSTRSFAYMRTEKEPAVLLEKWDAERVGKSPDAARRDAESAQGDPAASLIDQAIAAAVQLQRQEKIEAAREMWRYIANVAEGIDNQLQARAWFSVGYLHGEEDNRKEAINAYNEAIRLNPDNAEAYNNRGTVKRSLGQHEAALADYDKAIELNPDDATAYNNRGVTKKNLGRLNEAREDYQKALTLAQESGNEDMIAVAKRNLSRLGNAQAP